MQTDRRRSKNCWPFQDIVYSILLLKAHTHESAGISNGRNTRFERSMLVGREKRKKEKSSIRRRNVSQIVSSAVLYRMRPRVTRNLNKQTR